MYYNEAGIYHSHTVHLILLQPYVIGMHSFCPILNKYNLGNQEVGFSSKFLKAVYLLGNLLGYIYIAILNMLSPGKYCFVMKKIYKSFIIYGSSNLLF